jgi:hypothetical protein
MPVFINELRKVPISPKHNQTIGVTAAHEKMILSGSSFLIEA